MVTEPRAQHKSRTPHSPPPFMLLPPGLVPGLLTQGDRGPMLSQLALLRSWISRAIGDQHGPAVFLEWPTTVHPCHSVNSGNLWNPEALTADLLAVSHLLPQRSPYLAKPRARPHATA